MMRIHAGRPLGTNDISGSNEFGNKAYSINKVAEHIAKKGSSDTIPHSSNTTNSWSVDWSLY